ncbi:hypothetical protein BL253_36315 [Pseudofrankia asymbiotica]|uniref:Uncharacterized protein n=1 Tax=Pseudofrankia asymbiotica TaxID=1834516 RepID=A0A1V2HZN9_9ACTN|nr:hypothetical protein BL253_36315 [Pseudofrankia asymbiotica]
MRLRPLDDTEPVAFDGTFTFVLAHEDPGVANWLDTTGLGEGVGSRGGRRHRQARRSTCNHGFRSAPSVVRPASG